MSKIDITVGGELAQAFHFIGIGGVHMSGLAEILHKNGFCVTGSDRNSSDNTARLWLAGIAAVIGHDAANIPADARPVVVYNAAIPADNPEIAAAKQRGLHLISRAQLLGLLMQNYDSAICVAGTHGKTSTTSMLAAIFMQAGTDPTVLSGGVLPMMGGALRIGGRGVFIVEACEYHDSFLDFRPTTGVILNIDMDHSDYFADLAALERSFGKFAGLVPRGGCLVINNQINGIERFTARPGLECNVTTFGQGGVLRAENISYNASGCGEFDVFNGDTHLGRITLATPGAHNIENALAAITCAIHHDYGIDFADIAKGLASCTGAVRRFQHIGKFCGCDVIDDYAHHPTEIAATLDAAKNITHNKLWAVFQSHTNTRTRSFLPQFAQTLAAADETIILDIFNPAGREEQDHVISAEALVDEMRRLGAKAHYSPSFAHARDFLASNVAAGDMIVVMGAGDVGELAAELGRS